MEDDPQQPDEVIDRLYEVAVDPSRYEALLDRREAMIAPQRTSTKHSTDPILSFDHLTSNVERADQVLDRVTSADVPTGAHAVVSQIVRSAAFAVDRTMAVIAANAGAAHLLGLKDGSKVTALHLDDGDAEQLAHHIGRLIQSNSDDPVVLRGRTAAKALTRSVRS